MNMIEMLWVVLGVLLIQVYEMMMMMMMMLMMMMMMMIMMMMMTLILVNISKDVDEAWLPVSCFRH